jgi:2,5-furandicarboxylate decarboxylase 1
VEWFADRVRHPVPCREVAAGPVQETVWLGDDASLDRLPIGVHSPDDGGRYITSGVFVVRDPATGNLNTGIYRLMVAGARRITVNVAPAHDAARIIQAAAERGETCDFAIVFGGHPTFPISSQAKNPITVDAYELAGALQGEPLEVVRGTTVDLPVPAHAEIVIEGRIRATERQPEGPFGEFTYYYGAAEAWVAEVEAITMRHDPIFVDLHPAHVEHRCLWLFPGREARLLEFLRQGVPTVHRVHLPLPGGSLSAVISLRGARPGDARRALMLAMSIDVYIKQAVVVDDDIDIFDLDQVHWALTVRFQADRDTIVVPNCRGVRTDPSAYSLAEPGSFGPYTTKMGLDATVPLDRPFGPRADLPPPGYEDLDLAQYLPGALPGSMTGPNRDARG